MRTSILRRSVRLLPIGLLMGLTGAATSPWGQVAPLDQLMIYDGEWNVRAATPWSGAPSGAIDRMVSRCQQYTAYVACEQSLNGKRPVLVVITEASGPGRFNMRTIAPDGSAGDRGDLTIDGNRWTWLNRPAAGRTGPWTRVDNNVVDRDEIRFEEYESADGGKSWTETNRGKLTRSPTLARDMPARPIGA